MKLKEKTAQEIGKAFKLTEGTIIALFDNHIIDEEGARNFLIRKEYTEMIQSETPRTEAKSILADKFCLSFSMVDKVVLNRTR